MTVEVPEYGGCLWPVDSACFTDAWDGYPEAVKDRALALASSTLVRLTGGRVGNCPITVRPCSARVCRNYFPPDSVQPQFLPLNWGGVWMNVCNFGECIVDCEVPLPAPVGRIDEVKVDGAVIPATDYRVDGNRLVWTAVGECPFPDTQDLRLNDDAVGTFSVTYLNAYPVDSNGAYAAGILAAEYAKACTGGKCRLPTGVTSVARAGVTYEISSGAFPDGFTGIREVDTYIALWNPKTLSHSSRVWYPGMNTPRTTTIPGA